MVTKDYFVRLSVDAAKTRLGLMHPNERQQFLDAYLAERQIDLNNPPPSSDPRSTSQLEGYIPQPENDVAPTPRPYTTVTNDIAASSTNSPAGWIMIAVGAVLLIAAYSYDVSAGGYGYGRDVANLDKMSFRMMLLSTGLASIIVGNLCIGFSKVVHAMNSNRTGRESASV